MHAARILFLLALGALPLAALGGEGDDGGEGQLLDLNNKIVCWVNDQAISKREVEERMFMLRPATRELFVMKEKLKDAGPDNKYKQEVDAMYARHFREELVLEVKELLMLQAAKEQKMEYDKKNFEDALRRQTEDAIRRGIINSHPWTRPEIKARLERQFLIDEFQARTFITRPTRPEVEQFYKDHLERYQRKEALKVLRFKVDPFVTDNLGQRVNRESPSKICRQRWEEVTKYHYDFKDLVRDHSDDEADIKARGGLMLAPDGDEFVVPEDQTAALAAVLKGMKKDEVSKVFQFGTAWAFVKVLDVRPAGPQPLDEALYKAIDKSMREEQYKGKEDTWFRKALNDNLIMDGMQKKKFPMTFFFPDDPAEKVAATDGEKKSEPKKNADE
ncbi:MAG: peptidyl-prolyl cis-trans isomerase [Planctomycetes bacterium]|nr:peptidyl-prolyl cis-trans isomerase [Planctomycetota bacterium]